MIIRDIHVFRISVMCLTLISQYQPSHDIFMQKICNHIFLACSISCFYSLHCHSSSSMEFQLVQWCNCWVHSSCPNPASQTAAWELIRFDSTIILLFSIVVRLCEYSILFYSILFYCSFLSHWYTIVLIFSTILSTYKYQVLYISKLGGSLLRLLQCYIGSIAVHSGCRTCRKGL